MQIVCDLHLHSKYSRAVSPQMNIQTMRDFAVKKGINLLSVSDFTHPAWLKEISSEIIEREDGVYELKNAKRISGVYEPKFIFSTEISSIYKQDGKLRRIHSLVFASCLEKVEKINSEFVSRGCNLKADGRPIVGISAKDLLSMILEIDDKAMLIPAHIWTPHFGVYGSASGFDSIEEAFLDLSDYVYGVETGISSDPGMNWEIKELEKRSILSFSDAHSAPKMAREATVLGFKNQSSERDFSFDDIRRAFMRDKSSKLSILHTIEFYPEEGKYHFSGHRTCRVVFGPEQIAKKGSVCPSCGKRLTEGVLYRLKQLSDIKNEEMIVKKSDENGVLWYMHKNKKHPGYVKLVPLLEIIAESLSSSVASKKVKITYERICTEFSSELNVLLKETFDNLEKTVDSRIVEGIRRVRKGEINIDPGYDGEYGKVSIFRKGTSIGHGSPQLSIDF